MWKLIKFVILLALLGLLVAGGLFVWERYNEQTENGTTTPTTDEQLAWEDVPAVLSSGNVKQVTQLHNLTVYIALESGARYETTEPAIDDIFREIDVCGAPCDDIIVATE